MSPFRFASLALCVVAAVTIAASPPPDPKAPKDPLEKGIELSRKREWEQAVKAYDEAIRLNPKNAIVESGLDVGPSPAEPPLGATGVSGAQDSRNLGLEQATAVPGQRAGRQAEQIVDAVVGVVHDSNLGEQGMRTDSISVPQCSWKPNSRVHLHLPDA